MGPNALRPGSPLLQARLNHRAGLRPESGSKQEDTAQQETHATHNRAPISFAALLYLPSPYAQTRASYGAVAQLLSCTPLHYSLVLQSGCYRLVLCFCSLSLGPARPPPLPLITAIHNLRVVPTATTAPAAASSWSCSRPSYVATDWRLQLLLYLLSAG